MLVQPSLRLTHWQWSEELDADDSEELDADDPEELAAEDFDELDYFAEFP